MRRPLLLLVLLPLAGCLSIDPANGAYSCIKDGDCPGGYYCEPSSLSCWKRNQSPVGGVDASTNGDMSSTALPPDPAHSSIVVTADANTLVANGMSSATVSVTLHDANDQPLANVDVSVRDDEPTDVLAPPSGVTDPTGVFHSTLRANVGGDKHVKAMVVWAGGHLELDAAAVTFTALPPDASRSTIVVSPDSTPLIANGRSSATVTVTLHDANGRATSGVKITVSDGEPTDNFTPANGASDAKGLFSSSLKSTVGGDKVVKARVEFSGGTFDLVAPAVNFVPLAAATNSSLTVTDANVAADGSQSTAITVLVRDGNKNAVQNATVKLSVVQTLSQQASTQDHLTQDSATTDQNGRITGKVASTLAAAKTVVADVAFTNDPNGAFTLRQAVTFDPVPDAAQSTVTVSSAVVQANGSDSGSFTVTAADKNGVFVKGVTVSVFADDPLVHCAATSPTTSDTGQVNGSCTSTNRGDKTVSAKLVYSVDGLNGTFTIASAKKLTFTPQPSAANSTVSITPGVLANNHSPATINVTVLDYNHQPIQGASVGVTTTDTNTTVVPIAQPTDAGGGASTTMTSSTPTAKQITASVNGTVLKTVTYSFATVYAATLEVPAPGLPIPPDTLNATFDLPILVRDKDHWPLQTTSANVTVQLDQAGPALAGQLTLQNNTTTGVVPFHLTVSNYASNTNYSMTVSTSDTADGSKLSFDTGSVWFAIPQLGKPMITSAAVSGSDITIAWTAPSAQASCVLERSPDGASWATPPTLVECTPNPSATCKQDRWLLRGSYVYRVTCSATGQQPVHSDPTIALQPGIELCGTTGAGNSVAVHGIAAGSSKTERTISNSASNVGFNTAYGITADPGAGELWVTSRDNNTLKIFSRVAQDPGAASGERSLTLNPSGATPNPTPVGVALLGSEVIVAMKNTPFDLAGYPRSFASATTAPNWYLEGTSAGLHGPISITTDPVKNLIFVGNGDGSVTVYDRSQISASNHSGQPTGTRVITFGTPAALAIDPVARELFVADSDNNRIDVVNCDSASGTPTILRTITGAHTALSAPWAMQFVANPAGGGSLYVLNRSDGSINVYGSRASGDAQPTSQVATGDLVNGDGLAVCN